MTSPSPAGFALKTLRKQRVYHRQTYIPEHKVFRVIPLLQRALVASFVLLC